MFLALGIAIGVREQNALSCVFFLSFTTMWLGFVTEMLSRPRKDMKAWEGDPDPATPFPTALARFAAKMPSYTWRMAPHVLGFFPYITAWVILINNFTEQLNDLPEETRKLMPEWVVWAIAGSVTIFSSFTFVRYTTLKPSPTLVPLVWLCSFSSSWQSWHSSGAGRFRSATNGLHPSTTGAHTSLNVSTTYPLGLSRKRLLTLLFFSESRRTELWYCILSATSKVYLGGLLFANVLMRSRFSDADFVARWTPPP